MFGKVKQTCKPCRQREQIICDALWLLGYTRSLLWAQSNPATEDLRREINEFLGKVIG